METYAFLTCTPTRQACAIPSIPAVSHASPRTHSPGFLVHPKFYVNTAPTFLTRASASAPPKSSSSSSPSSSSPSSSIDALKETLFITLESADRGISLPEITDEITSDLDIEIEGILQDLEDLNPTQDPGKAMELLKGKWRLVFTNSSLVRFHRGMTAIHKAIPLAKSADLIKRHEINSSDSSCYYTEKIQTPVFSFDVLVEGALSFKDNSTLMWAPEVVKMGPLRFFAETWKGFRPFASNEVTFLDHSLLIERGQTGHLFAWEKLE